MALVLSAKNQVFKFLHTHTHQSIHPIGDLFQMHSNNYCDFIYSNN